MEVPFVIRPVIHKNYIVRVSFFIVLLSSFVVGVELTYEKFDLERFMFSVVFAILIFYIVFKLEYNSITIEKEQLVYDGGFKKTIIKLEDITNICLSYTEEKNELKYSLCIFINFEKKCFMISGIRAYGRAQIEKLIDIIGDYACNPKEEIKNLLNEIEWKF